MSLVTPVLSLFATSQMLWKSSAKERRRFYVLIITITIILFSLLPSRRYKNLQTGGRKK